MQAAHLPKGNCHHRFCHHVTLPREIHILGGLPVQHRAPIRRGVPIRHRAAGPGTIACPITSVAGHAAISFPCSILLRFRDGGRCVRFLMVASLLLSGMLQCQLSAQAIPGGARHSIAFPNPPGRAAAGFLTSVRFSDFSSFGYQPVEILFEVPVATSADLRLVYRVVNLAETQTPDDNRLSVDIPILVPEGTKNGRWVRYLPKWMYGNGYEVSVIRDGQTIPGYRGVTGDTTKYMQLGRYLDWRQQAVGELSTNLLLITDTPQLSSADRLALAGLNLPWRFVLDGPWVSASDALKMSSSRTRYNVLPVTAHACGNKGLPHDWRGYERWDLIVLSKSGIESLKGQRSEWDALYGWILCGGTIVVWDAESQAELDGLFAQPGRKPGKPSRDQIRGLGIDVSNMFVPGLEFSPGQDLVQSPNPNPPTAKSPANSPSAGQSPDKPAPGSPRFYFVSLGAGKAISVDGLPGTSAGQKNLQPPKAVNRDDFGDESRWKYYTRLMKSDSSYALRRGADPVLGNTQYYNWLVPGVAQPPVYALVGFLSVFIVVVGPIAYRRTSKSGRTHLMFVIAPALALFTTASMFAYGIVADGFSTVGRMRQVTWVDGATGNAGERVLETYFAPISPRDGVSFPGDAEVFSVEQPAEKTWEFRHNLDAAPRGSVVVTPELQRFSSSFLPSREQRQFVSHRPRFNVGRLNTRLDGSVQPSLVVTNEFKFRVQDAVLRDHSGAYWRIQDLAPGSTGTADAIGPSTASKLLGSFYLDHRPVASGGVSPSLNRRPYGIRDLTSELARWVGSVDSREGRFEGQLREQLQVTSSLPMGGFTAKCDLDMEVPAVKGAILEDSVHYVMGTLP